MFVRGCTSPKIAEGARPEIQPPDEFEPGCVTNPRPGQRSISERSSSTPSQTGIGLSSALRLDLAQVLLCEWRPQAVSPAFLRRLRLPLSFSVHSCRCGGAIDIFGHHRAACARAGVLGRRGFAPESAVARICREAGCRVATNTFMRDMDLAVPATDNRRLEVVVDGLPLCGGSHLAIDTTLVCAMHCDDSPHFGDARDGAQGGRRDGTQNWWG